VLYVALIMLILLALIGIVGTQVSTLQERMASNYRQANLAFQAAETNLSAQESAVAGAMATAAGIPGSMLDDGTCGQAGDTDASTWAAPLIDAGTEAANFTRDLTRCYYGAPLAVGVVTNQQDKVIQIYSLGSDVAVGDTPTASVVVDAIFVP
jgi:type IV pilus assembly protein PilX